VIDSPHILVIDDDPQIHRFLGPALEEAGYVALRADSGEEGLRTLVTRPPDGLILDLGLPDMDGIVVLERARGFFAGPILIISARGDPAVKIQALDLGADDYVHKPFAVGELLARLRVATRNKVNLPSAVSVISTGALEIDLDRRLVLRHGVEVRLSTHEYNLLAELAKSADRVLTHGHLLTAVWGPDNIENIQYLRVFVQRLRQKLEENPSSPRHVLTENGVGYRFRR
jgi:two-component system, OmpR family, KDP operon response regulator KdpE